MEENSPATVAMVFAGGLGLAAYHAGVYQAFSQKCLPLHWVAGSSAGAATAALIAGNRAEDRIARMRAFWNFPPIETYRPAPWRHRNGWLGAVRSRVVGNPGHFSPSAALDEPIWISQPLRSFPYAGAAAEAD